MNLYQEFGNLDIYIFDQLLKGRFQKGQAIIDVGCGGGRNLVYFLRQGFEVYGVDQNGPAIESLQALAAELAPNLPRDHFRIAPVEQLPFDDNTFDVVISNAVLHFARDQQHFESMLHSMWRVLKKNGFFFARLASDAGIQDLVRPTQNGRYQLPDGSERYLVSMEALLAYTEQLGGRLFEPIKTTNVQNLRCMTTWCMRK